MELTLVVDHHCNLRCAYCYAGDKFSRRMSDEVMRSAIDLALARHPRQLDLGFIGGEPTLHPDLAVLVGRARERGFARVSICTNGALLLRPHALDRLVEAGLTGLRFSFHDHRVEVANALADVPGLGTRYLDVASMLLARRDLELSFHRMLLARNVDALEDYVRWIAARDRTGRPLHLGLLLPSRRGRMLRFADEFPPLAALRERVASGVALAEAHGFAVTLHHLPVCVLPAAAERNAYLHVRTVHVEDGRQGEVDFEGDARRGDACAGCAAAERGCPGLVGAYFDADRSAAEAWLRPIARRDDAPT